MRYVYWISWSSPKGAAATDIDLPCAITEAFHLHQISEALAGQVETSAMELVILNFQLLKTYEGGPPTE
jgi:hypothetical protein